jgi:hypothetical protein
MLLKYPPDTWSIELAAGESLRGVYTPATTQALRSFSNLPIFMLNSTLCSLHLMIFK